MTGDKHEKTKFLVDNIKSRQQRLLAELKRCGFKISEKIGPENEYEVRGVVAGLDCLLTDVKLLVRSRERYFSKTTILERDSLITILEEIDTIVAETCEDLEGFEDNEYHVDNGQPLAFTNSEGEEFTLSLVALPECIDKIKPLLRGLRLRDDPERTEIIEESIASLQCLITSCETKLAEISSIKDRSAEILKKVEGDKTISLECIDDVNRVIKDFEVKLEAFEENASTIESLQTKSEELNEEISETHTNAIARYQEINSKKEVVDVFVKKIIDRELQLEKQGSLTIEYQETVAVLKKEQVDFLEKAKILIRDAQEALRLSGSVALGRHFQEQYDDARRFFHRWLWGAASFILVAICIGLWVLIDHKNSNDIAFAIARLSLMPIALAGAWFCASQFVKQKRIIEDYAYKKVLALSLVSFREELQSIEVADHTKAYLEMVLREIHRYPLEALQSGNGTAIDRDLVKEIKNVIPDLLKTLVKTDGK